MKLRAICPFLFLLATVPASAISVSVSAPANNANVTSPFNIRASATPTSGYVVTGWHIYIDSVDSYSAGAVTGINTNLSAAVGTHSVVIRAWDSSGADASQTLTIHVVNQGVTVSVSTPANGATVYSPVNVQASAVSAYPITGWHIYVDSTDSYSAGQTTSINANIPVSTGTHTLVIRAWDSTGANGDQTITVTAASPNIAVNVSAPANGATVSSPTTIQASATSAYTITAWHIYVDSTDAFSAGQTNSISPSLSLSAGSHQLVIRAWDSSGAYASQTVNVTVVNAVQVNLTAPANGATVNSPVSIQASATSGHSITGWHIYVDSVDSYSAGAVTSISPSLSMSNGSHTIVVRAWDSTGAYGDQTATVNVVSSGVSVSVSTPQNNASVSSPFTVAASASSANPITAWHIYLDSTDVFSQSNVSSINTSINASSGSHQLVIRAWDSSGAYGDQTINITVGTSGPPPNAQYQKIDEIPSWSICTGGCGDSGGGGNQPTTSQGLVASPSEDGKAHQFNISAPSTMANTYPNAYWFVERNPGTTPASPTSLATQVTYSFDLRIPSGQENNPQAIEWEVHQQFGGTVYNMAWQARYAGYSTSVMEMFTYQWQNNNCPSGPQSGWYDTGVSFPRFSPDTWHHVQVDYHVSGTTIYFDDVIVDGTKKTPLKAATHTAVAPTCASYGNKFNNAVQQDMDKNVDPWTIYIDNMNISYQ